MTTQARTDAVILSRYRAGDRLPDLETDYDMGLYELIDVLLRAQFEETKEACAKEAARLAGNQWSHIATAIRALPTDAGNQKEVL